MTAIPNTNFTVENFTLRYETLRISGAGAIDSVLTICQEWSIPEESIKKYINSKIESEIKVEATSMNFLKKEEVATLDDFI